MRILNSAVLRTSIPIFISYMGVLVFSYIQNPHAGYIIL